MRYFEFIEQSQRVFDELPMKAAFGKHQFAEMMAAWGLTTSEEDVKKIHSLGNGCFCRVEDSHLFYDRANKQDNQMREFLSDEERLKDALRYEFANHECGYTGNWKAGVLALFDEEEIESNELLKKVLPIVWKEYLNKCE